MNKYEYNNEENERLTEVSVDKVWLKEDLLSEKSVFKRMYPEAWKFLNEGAVIKNFPSLDLKQMIVGNDELFIVFITTNSQGLMDDAEGRKVPCDVISQKAFLTDKQSYIDITVLMAFTNLIGCRFQHLDPPFEDFINEFICEIYF